MDHNYRKFTRVSGDGDILRNLTPCLKGEGGRGEGGEGADKGGKGGVGHRSEETRIRKDGDARRASNVRTRGWESDILHIFSRGNARRRQSEDIWIRASVHQRTWGGLFDAGCSDLQGKALMRGQVKMVDVRDSLPTKLTHLHNVLRKTARQTSPRTCIHQEIQARWLISASASPALHAVITGSHLNQSEASISERTIGSKKRLPEYRTRRRGTLCSESKHEKA